MRFLVLFALLATIGCINCQETQCGLDEYVALTGCNLTTLQPFIDPQNLDLSENNNPFMIFSWLVPKELLLAEINNPNIELDLFDGKGVITISNGNNWLNFGKSGTDYNWIAVSPEFKVYTYGRIRNPDDLNGPMLVGRIVFTYIHTHPDVCLQLVLNDIVSAWNNYCSNITVAINRSNTGSSFDFHFSAPANYSAGATETLGIPFSVAQPLVKFVTNADRAFEFTFVRGNNTVHISNHLNYSIFDVKLVHLDHFNSTFIDTFAQYIRDPTAATFNGLNGIALLAQHYDQPDIVSYPDLSKRSGRNISITQIRKRIRYLY